MTEKPDRKIDQIYTLIAEDKSDGLEGIIGTFPPFLVSSKENADILFKQWKPKLLESAHFHGQNVKIKLVRFSVRETIEIIE